MFVYIGVFCIITQECQGVQMICHLYVCTFTHSGIPPKNYSFLHNYIKIHARYHQTMTIHSQSFNLFECNCKVFTYLILFIIMSLMIKINPNSQDESALILFCVLLCNVHITHSRTWFR